MSAEFTGAVLDRPAVQLVDVRIRRDRSNPRESTIRAPVSAACCGTGRYCFGRTSTRRSGRHRPFPPSRRLPPRRAVARRGRHRRRTTSARVAIASSVDGSDASATISGQYCAVGPNTPAPPAAVPLSGRPARSVLLIVCVQVFGGQLAGEAGRRHTRRCRTRARLGSPGDTTRPVRGSVFGRGTDAASVLGEAVHPVRGVPACQVAV